MKKILVVLICSLPLIAAQSDSAAIKYKRFPACAGGPVTEKTFECHASAAPVSPRTHRFHYCHAGESCDTTTGKCSK
jgi:hypothetical protein